MLFFIKMLAWCLTMILWFIVGFYLWVPLILVVIMIYVAASLAAAYSPKTSWMLRSEKLLENTVRLYPHGFHRIHLAIFRPSQEEAVESEESPWVPLMKLFLGGAMTLIAATCVWLGLAWIYAAVTSTTPVWRSTKSPSSLVGVMTSPNWSQAALLPNKK